MGTHDEAVRVSSLQFSGRPDAEGAGSIACRPAGCLQLTLAARVAARLLSFWGLLKRSGATHRLDPAMSSAVVPLHIEVAFGASLLFNGCRSRGERSASSVSTCGRRGGQRVSAIGGGAHT